MRWLFIAVVAAVLFGSGSARAQESGEEIRAKKLFDAALELMDRGSHATACPMLEESLSLDPGMGTKYYLARCYEKVGRLASAYELLIEVATEAKAEGKRDREKHTRRAAKKLAPRLPKLTVNVPEELAAFEGLQTTVDRKPLPRKKWGRPVAIDLGEHEVVARQKGTRTAWRRKVWITKERQTVSVDIPVLESLRPPSTAAPAARSREPEPVPKEEEPADRPPTPEGVDGMLVGGIASLVVAAGALVVHNWAAWEVHSVSEDDGFQAYQQGFSSDQNVCESARNGVPSASVGAPAPSEVADMCDMADNMEIVQAIMVPTSIALTTLGVILAVMSDTAQGYEPDSEAPDVAVQLGPDAVGLQLRWTL